MEFVIGMNLIAVAILIGFGALGVGIALYFAFANPYIHA